MGQNCLKKLSKFYFDSDFKILKFQSSNFTLTWSNEGETNSVPPDMIIQIELQQKNENTGQTYL